MIVPFHIAMHMQAEHGRRVQRLRKKAEQQIRLKFPRIVVGGSGWRRAVDLRLAKLLRTEP